MERETTARRIDELEREIAALPAGSIGTKNVAGHSYSYLRWRQDGGLREKYLRSDEVEAVRQLVDHRLELEAELRALRQAENATLSSCVRVSEVGPLPQASVAPSFRTNVRRGKALAPFVAPVRDFKKRACYQQLDDYLQGMGPTTHDKVLVLYGLRRTGKTTLIRQAVAGMDAARLGQAAFIQVVPGNTLADLNVDLKLLESLGCRFVFIDEVTLLEDFIEGAALFSDVFAAGGMRVVLSGTDSLGFLFTQDEQLYDRCVLVHTTHVPYREFEEVLGVRGIDEYIRYGGTMSLGGARYNETSTFATVRGADEYVDSAIAHNIQHSLRCYQYGGHFRHLQDLFDRDELTSVINRVVEDINHRFTLEVLTRRFKSNDLALSASNLRRDRANPTDVLDRVDVAAVTERLRQALEIRDAAERSAELDDVHAREIKEYLDLLDLTEEIDVLALPDVSLRRSRTVLSQPGLRYAQVSALLESLLLDATFADLSLAERNAVLGRIADEVRGRMMEDIVLLETKKARPRCQVFVLQFSVGEFDMVVFDPAAASCEIYEIKHSGVVVPQQRRHLVDPEKRAATEHRFGSIVETCVLYRGAPCEEDGVRYRNVEEYLRGL